MTTLIESAINILLPLRAPSKILLCTLLPQQPHYKMSRYKRERHVNDIIVMLAASLPSLWQARTTANPQARHVYKPNLLYYFHNLSRIQAHP